MTRFSGVFLLALPAAVVLAGSSALAQGYYRAPPPSYRGGPPPGAYDAPDLPPGAWINEDGEVVMRRPYGAPRMGQQVPRRFQPGAQDRALPYPQDADAEALPPPGFVSPGGRTPGYGYQPDQRAVRGAVASPATADDPSAIRPPAAVGGAPAAVPQGARPSPSVMTLPPEDQPEVGQPKELPANLKKQLVDYATREPAGTIIIDTPNTYLYLVLGHGKALRYGIGVGREGFTWAGAERISKMSEWPDWHPPAEMIERQPYLPRFMAGGPGNPLGARALYLGKTLYRIHGTNQPSTIGQNVSSGCIRLLNEDIEDLYSRVQVGSRVVVLPGKAPQTANAGMPGAVGGPVVAAPVTGGPAGSPAISSRPLPPVR